MCAMLWGVVRCRWDKFDRNTVLLIFLRFEWEKVIQEIQYFQMFTVFLSALQDFSEIMYRIKVDNCEISKLKQDCHPWFKLLKTGVII